MVASPAPQHILYFEECVKPWLCEKHDSKLIIEIGITFYYLLYVH